jgi:DNA-directed RNA polymerase specialized sigma24 family protein
VTTTVARVSADTFVAVVRAYADRVHDDVRRLGCRPAEAAEIVETSALDVIERLKFQPDAVTDVVGEWFRAARVLAQRLVAGRALTRSDVTPDAGDAGLLASSDDDRAARDRLAELDEVDRLVVLLRDTDALPVSSVAVAMSSQPEAVPPALARARLRFAGAEVADDHLPDLGRLVCLVDGELSGTEKRSITAHAARCPVCQAAQPHLAQARDQLRALAVVALADADRDAILERVGVAARRHLPTAAQLAALGLGGWRQERPRWGVVVSCLGGAALLGAVMGAATAGGNATAGGPARIPLETGTPSATPSGSPTPSPTPTPTPTSASPTGPTPTPTSIPTSARPTGTATPTTSSTSATAATITISPRTGSRCATVTVSGRGWPAGRTVTVAYRDLAGTTYERASAVAGDDGRFLTTIPACGPLPGPYTVRATSTGRSAEESFTQTA